MKIANRRAKYDYHVFESFEAGIVLTGEEIKSLKLGRGNLASSFVKIREGEAWLLGANIPQPGSSGSGNYDATRPRKLLLHKKEIISFETKLKQQKLTLIPLLLYNKGPLIKVRVAFTKGKRQYEKREYLKKKDIEREAQKALKGY